MNSILQNITASAAFARLEELVRGGHMPCSLECVAPGARTHVAEALRMRTGRHVLVVCASDYAAKQLYSAHIYPEKCRLPSQQVELGLVETKGNAVAQARVAALAALAGPPQTVYLSVDALAYRMPPAARFYERFERLRPGMTLPPAELAARLARMGYERVPLIEAPGQTSGRGEILELFPPDAELPLRITFFDDEIESIRRMDTGTQRSVGAPLEEAVICPARELFFDGQDAQAIEETLRAAGGKHARQVAERFIYELGEQGAFPNIEAFTGLLKNAQSVLDYAPQALVLFDGCTAALAAWEKRRSDADALFAGVLSEGEAFGCERGCYFDVDELLAQCAPRALDFAGVQPRRGWPELHMDMRSAVGCGGNLALLTEEASARVAAGWRIYLYAAGRARALSQALEEHGLMAPPIGAGKMLAQRGAVTVSASLPEGFELTGEKTLLLGEHELFGRHVRGAKQPRGKRAAQKAEDLLGDLKPGDVVVHDIHGKGRFIGLKSMEVGGVAAEYIELEYRGGDRLFIQTAQIDRVQKYVGPGSDEEETRLSKLGGKEWETQKQRARNSVKRLAENLSELYTERAHMQGYAYAKDTVWQRQFEDNFEYEETEGQLESIRQIKRDMQSGKVMDRLLLGDVGYGKTEVAMRACFKAVMDSRQVAVLVPTTLLARQHLETFRNRFAGFPVRIEMLSRFTKRPAQVLAGLADGGVDIVIGTHKLLSPQVQFKDLGLLVIDEEQRFGVSHKERIKNLRRTVDVLTLTATPIPRTLEMAMTGIRDMSTIDTPPQERKEVQAFVAQFSWGLVREAVMKELARGGQVYFVCRQIGQMDELLARLKEAVPEARVCSAHGQMSEAAFERVISSFYDREYDVLLCTTIIESGIDIPSVNTIIVYEADKFGLAQLYQLKGRVGRSHLRAYAYFTHLNDGELSELAARRLSAIREFTQFGSGFKIAMRDLEIRGAGNVLGPEQSGHMAQVGYHLYCQMVREEVDEVMGRPKPPQAETAVELGADALIPAAYISDEAQKLDMYRRIAGVRTLEQAKDVRAEFSERFGKPPAEVENLLVASVVRAYAERACIASVLRKGSTFELKFAPDARLDLKRLAPLIASYGAGTQLRQSTPPVIHFSARRPRVYSEMLQLLEQIRRCIYARDQV